MKKNFLRIAIMAIFAVTLLAGSALAGPIYGDLYEVVGNVQFNGNAVAGVRTGELDADDNYIIRHTNQNGDIFAMTVLENELYPGTYTTITRPGSGIFAGYIPGSSWDPKNVVGGFPSMVGMMFKDDETSAVMGNILMFDTFSLGDTKIGDISGFNFYSTELFNDPDNYPGLSFSESDTRIGFNLIGNVEFNGDVYLAEYSVTFNNVNGDPYLWTWDIQVDVYERDTPPETPEPGTLVLLGTGIVGAAIVARKKVKK